MASVFASYTYANASRRLLGQRTARDDIVRTYQDTVFPDVQRRPGFRGAFLCTNSIRGEGVSVTLWDTEQQARAAQAEANERLANFRDVIPAGRSIQHVGRLTALEPAAGFEPKSARVTVILSKPDAEEQVDRRMRERVLPTLRDTPGVDAVFAIRARARGGAGAPQKGGGGGKQIAIALSGDPEILPENEFELVEQFRDLQRSTPTSKTFDVSFYQMV